MAYMAVSHCFCTVLQGLSEREDSLIRSVLQQGHFTEHDVVCLLRQLVLDGAVLGSPQQELLNQFVQLRLAPSPLHTDVQPLHQPFKPSLDVNLVSTAYPSKSSFICILLLCHLDWLLVIGLELFPIS